MRREGLGEAGVEERLERPAQGLLEETGVEQGRERVSQPETHRGAVTGQKTRRWSPLPGRAVSRSEVPARGDVARAAACFRHDLVAREQAELDADAGKADPLSAGLPARRDVVIAG